MNRKDGKEIKLVGIQLTSEGGWVVSVNPDTIVRVRRGQFHSGTVIDFVLGGVIVREKIKEVEALLARWKENRQLSLRF